MSTETINPEKVSAETIATNANSDVTTELKKVFIDDLEKLYEKVLNNDNYQLAFSIRKKIIRLRLPKTLQHVEQLQEESEQLANKLKTIREYLDPLGLTKEETSTVELVRLAVRRILDIRQYAP
jgi:hypothetical protein